MFKDRKSCYSERFVLTILLSDSNGIRTHNHLVRKRTLKHLVKLASLAKWLSVRLRTKDCGFESRCFHLNFRYHACFEQGVP